MSKQINGNKLRIGGRRCGNFVCDNATEIIGERMACSINGRFILTKIVSSLVYAIYKNKVQIDWKTEYKKQNS